MKEKVIRLLKYESAWHWLGAYLVVALIGFQDIRGGDLLWHIKLGQHFLESGQFLQTDIFSHTMRGAVVMPHAALFQLLVGFVYEHAHWAGLVLLRSLLLVSLFSLTVIFARKLHHESMNHSWLLAAIFALGNPQFDLHPQLFFFIFVMALLCLGPFSPQKSQSKSAIVAGGIIILWPYFHPSFPFGVALMMLFGVISLIQRGPLAFKNAVAWFGSAGVSLGVIALLNWKLIENVWVHAESPVMLANVQYWKSIWSVVAFRASDLWITANLLGLAVLFLILVVQRKCWVKGPFFLAVVGCGAIVATLVAVRFLPLVPLILGPTLIAFWGKHIRQVAATIYLALSAIFFGFTPGLSFGFSLDDRELPVACVEYLKTHVLPGNLYNSYGFGGYVLFELGESHPVFIDPRSSQLYPDSFFREFIESTSNSNKFDELVKRYGVGHTLLKAKSVPTQKLIHYLDQNADWMRVFSSETCVVHEKRGHALK